MLWLMLFFYLIISTLIVVGFYFSDESGEPVDVVKYAMTFIFWLPMLMILLLMVIAYHVGEIWKSTQTRKKL